MCQDRECFIRGAAQALTWARRESRWKQFTNSRKVVIPTVPSTSQGSQGWPWALA
ncbi:hypothetical protein D3C86_2260170 [compost metagenome]